MKRHLILLGIAVLFFSIFSAPLVAKASYYVRDFGTDPLSIGTFNDGATNPDGSCIGWGTDILLTFTLTQYGNLTLGIQDDTWYGRTLESYSVYIDGNWVGDTSDPVPCQSACYYDTHLAFPVNLNPGFHHIEIVYNGSDVCPNGMGFLVSGSITYSNTCGGAQYTPAPDKVCCGGPNNPNAVIYNPLIGQDCCTDVTKQNGPVQIYYPGKTPPGRGETCCLDVANNPNVCNGCQACVSANTTYYDLNAPVPIGNGQTDWHCPGTTNPVTKGQCMNNCQNCTTCVNGPDKNGDFKNGQYCQNLGGSVASGGKLATDFYAAHPATNQPGGIYAGGTFSCSCGSGPAEGLYGGHWQQSCFYLGPQTISGFNNCPKINGSVDTQTNAGCFCGGPRNCGISQKDAQGKPLYVCSNVPCSQRTPALISTNLTPQFFYDCGANSYCCSNTPPPQTSYCYLGMFCEPWGTGAPCKSIYDCCSPGMCPNPPPPCPAGQTNPYYTCQNNSCWLANGCGTSDCSACGGCPAGQTDPHYTCDQNNACNPVNGCGVTDCSACGGCGPGQTNPHSECVAGVCTSKNTCGATDCSSCACPAGQSNPYWTCQKGEPTLITNSCGKSNTLACGGCPLGMTNPYTRCQGGVCTVIGTCGTSDCSACQCPAGQTNPHVACDTNGVCSPVNTCGVSDCSACVCAHGKTNPYTMCQDGVCKSFDECGVSDCSNCGVCPAGKTNPYYTCQGGVCAPSTGCGVTNCSACNQPPVASNLQVNPGDYCSYPVTGIPASGLATFQWNYSDSENDFQIGWQMQVSTASGSGFDANMVFNSCPITGSGDPDNCMTNGTANTVQIPVLLASSGSSIPHITYGVHYYWRVKVWENITGLDSGWINYVDTHTFSPLTYNGNDFPNHADDKDNNQNTYTYPYPHPAPMVSYTPPASIVLTPPASTFTDNNSTCYNDSGSSYACNSSSGTSYSWWFDYVHKTTPDDTTNKVSASHQYTTSGAYMTKLQICDNVGCCYDTKNVHAGPGSANISPQWWEISPY